MRAGLVTVAVRVTGGLVEVTPFEGSGTPGRTAQLTLPAGDDELGRAVLGAAATLR